MIAPRRPGKIEGMASLRVSITFLATGGRQGPVSSGYRPQLFFGGEDWECRRIDFLPDRTISPGESTAARIVLSDYAASALAGRMQVGDSFQLREGSRAVADGLLIETE